MKIHIGNRRTRKTRCGESIARRWWVESTHSQYETIGGLIIRKRVKPQGVSCKQCLRGKGT